MRTTIMIGTAFLTIGLLGAEARAERVTLTGNYSASHVKAACEQAGGDYVEDANTNSFGCTSDCQNTGNNNTDQDHCVVTCSNNSSAGNCDGWVPDRVSGPRILDLKSLITATPKTKTVK